MKETLNVIVMITANKTTIAVKTEINAPVEKVWSYWTDPKHIMNWNNASEDWYTPRAENDFRVGGRFNYRMEARDGNDGFDFAGEYTNIALLHQIKYTMDDGRTTQVYFSSDGNKTVVTEIVETEKLNSVELQMKGWQAILNNFRKYVEKSAKTEMLHFEILIEAPPEKVFNTMIDEKDYSNWTSEFNPTSRFKGSWEKGSKILFLGEAQDGSLGGMVSIIKENIRNRFISIEHLGVVENGREILCGPDVDRWAGALENYTFTEKDGKTLLSIDADSDDKYRSYFITTWPRALRKLKSICEQEFIN
jgi:uncharacterized protein YndB with AHSA1/START domain